jgi:DNA primase
MPVIKPTCIRDLKLRVSVADVVSRVVALRKSGSRLKGLCPFHSEKTPSFHVDPSKGFYKCFGCGKAGDVITFVRDTEQLSFTEAVEALGQRFGVPIEYEAGAGPTREQRSLRQEIFDIHEQAAGHFHETFKAPGPAGDFMREYWTVQRRFPLDLAEDFKVGAAAPDDAGLAARLLRTGYSEAALRQCGLFFMRDGTAPSAGSLRPRFRGRLMIPIRDHQGRIVAFTARQTSLTPADDPAREAKYVNSPETPIFTKGNLLFNLDRARTAVGDGHPFVLVEGQLDALRCWQVGLKTALAPQGTAITETQLSLMGRYHTQVECFFDSDAAGQKASLRLLPMALRAGLEVRFLTLDGAGKVDPDLLFLEHGLAAYEAVKRGSLSAMAFACRAALPAPGEASPEGKSRAAQAVIEIIAAAHTEVARSEFLAEASAHLRLPQAALERDYHAFLARQGRRAAVPQAQDRRQPSAPSEAGGQADSALDTPRTSERDLLLICLHYETLGKPMSAVLPNEWIDTGHTAGILLNRILGEFEHDTWAGRDHLDGLLETAEEKALAASLLFDSPGLDDPVKVAQEGLRRLRARALEPRLRQLELALATARDDSKVDPISLLKEQSELRRQLQQPLVLAVPA